MGPTRHQHRIALVLDEGKAIIVRIGNVLRFIIWRVDRVNCNNTVCLIREEARRVVGIDDGRSGKDALSRPPREDGNGLVDPSIQVVAGGVALSYRLLHIRTCIGAPHTQC